MHLWSHPVLNLSIKPEPSCEVLKHTVGIENSISFILQGTFLMENDAIFHSSHIKTFITVSQGLKYSGGPALHLIIATYCKEFSILSTCYILQGIYHFVNSLYKLV